MTTLAESINHHYGGIDLCAHILDRLRAAGVDPDALTRDDCAPFDEFHGGGRTSTRALAQLAGFGAGMNVIDVGSGVGGPARTLAAEFGCTVTGVDLTEAFCAVADMLTERLEMTGQVCFQCASALDLPFDDETYDAAWSQNMFMNIEDKDRLFAEVYRVLRPGGLFAFEGVIAGNGGAIIYPVMWADTAEISFVVDENSVRGSLAAAGFVERRWTDTSERAIATARKRLETMQPDAPAPLRINLIVTRDFRQKLDNGVRNILDRRISPMLAVFEKPR